MATKKQKFGALNYVEDKLDELNKELKENKVITSEQIVLDEVFDEIYESGSGEELNVMHDLKKWNVFTLLGASKQQKDFLNSCVTSVSKIRTFLENKNFTENNSQDLISKSKYAKSYEDIIRMTARAYINPSSTDDLIVRELVNDIKREEAKILPKDYKLGNTKSFGAGFHTIEDYLKLEQYERVNNNPEFAKHLLTERQIDNKFEHLSASAKPFGKIKGQDVYDVSQLKARNVSGLNVPFRKEYAIGNKTYLTEAQQNSTRLEELLNDLSVGKGYKFGRSYDKNERVKLVGKTFGVNAEGISKTETATLVIYEYCKNKAKIDANDVIKGYENKISITDENGYPYLIKASDAVKKRKRDIYGYARTLESVIGTLAAVNMARLYMEPDAFKLAERNLKLQAAQTLGRIPNEDSNWVLPLVAEKVLEITKENYAFKGVETVKDLEKLYKMNGYELQNADELTNIDQAIFGVVEKLSYEKQKQVKNEQEQEKQKQQEEVNEPEVKEDSGSLAFEEDKPYTIEEIQSSQSYMKFLEKHKNGLKEAARYGNKVAQEELDLIEKRVHNKKNSIMRELKGVDFSDLNPFQLECVQEFLALYNLDIESVLNAEIPEDYEIKKPEEKVKEEPKEEVKEEPKKEQPKPKKKPKPNYNKKDADKIKSSFYEVINKTMGNVGVKAKERVKTGSSAFNEVAKMLNDMEARGTDAKKVLKVFANEVFDHIEANVDMYENKLTTAPLSEGRDILKRYIEKGLQKAAGTGKLYVKNRLAEIEKELEADKQP